MNLILIKILLLLVSPISTTIALDKTINLPPIFISPPPPPLPPPPPPAMAPFKPSIAVIVAVLTAMFSVTFLLLLYAKHCKRGNENNDISGYFPSGVPASAAARKTSGVDRTTIESLPVFRFGALSGEKDGLECAVCLNRFEEAEVLRLLPKCKHAFHVECVDTWLEAHSTCPLCRYRVDPEDVLLCNRRSVAEAVSVATQPPTPPPLRRVSGRHSSAGETRGQRLQVIVEKDGRRSCDSRVGKKEKERKDDVLLADKDRSSDRRKLEHRIVIGEENEMKQRWSDVQPSDLLYLRSEMIMSDSRRLSTSNSGSRPLKPSSSDGRSVINGRSVSEITGLSRFKKETTTYNKRREDRVLLSRWLAWVPQSQSHMDTQLPALR